MPETEPDPAPNPEFTSEPASWEYSLYIPNDLRAVTVSRRTLRLILTMHGLIGLVDVAELLASELVILKDLPDRTQTLLAMKDQEVTWLGQRVLSPGGVVEKIVHGVWIPESKDVRKNIEALAG